MKTVTFKELTNTIATEHDISSKQVREILRTFSETIITNTKKGNKIAIPGVGTFFRSKRKARTGRNPHTGAEMKIPARWAPRFKVSKSFKTTVRT